VASFGAWDSHKMCVVMLAEQWMQKKKIGDVYLL